MKRIMAGLFGVAALTVITATALDFYRTIYVAGITDVPLDVELSPGETFSEMSDRLSRAGVISNRFHWRAYAAFRGADRRIKAGMYRIEAGATLHTLLDDLVEGNTLRYRFTIQEGWTLREIIAAMRKHPQLAVTSERPEEIRKRLGIAEASPEGWIYPETYFFEKDTSNLNILRQGHEIMKEKLASAWEKRSPASSLENAYDALILASIVEKETAVEAERARIAGVFLSRLERGMRLQTDPTVIYGLGEAFDGNLRRRDLKEDTPYNSYTRKGLPPTPISMPSEKSINAVLNPEITGELYFVSKSDGSHHFSKTYEEHQAAVRRYQMRR